MLQWPILRHSNKSSSYMVFPVVMYRCESWTLKLRAKEFWTVVLEKSLESLLDRKEIQPVHPKGNQSWIFIGRIDAKAETPILWPPDVKNWLIGKDPDAGKYWRQEGKGTTGDKMAGWHHQLSGHEFQEAPGVGDREAWHAAGHGVVKSQTQLRDWTELNWATCNCFKEKRERKGHKR